MLLHRMLAVLLMTVGLGAVAAAPASAEPAPAVSLADLSTATPGHVTGTVVTEASHVWICFASCQVNTGQTHDGAWLEVPADTHQLAFDLPTWGFAGGTVGAASCAADPGANQACAEPSTVESETLTTTDLRPTVELAPLDGKVGVGETLEAAVTDSADGGELRAVWVNPQGANLATTLAPNATTPIATDDGTGTVVITRCQSPTSDFCQAFDPPLEYAATVRTKLTTTAVHDGPATPVHPSVTFTVDGDGVGLIEDGLSLHDELGQPVDAALTVDAATDGTGGFHVRVDAGGLAEGYYTLVGTVTVDDADFGALAGPILGEDGLATGFAVDRTGAPLDGLTLSRSVIHPRAISALAAHRTTTITVTAGDPASADRVEIRSGDTVVRHLTPSWSGTVGTAVWGGRNDSCVLVPEASYTVVVVDVDGNRSTLQRTVTVSHAAGVLRTWRRTVSAAGSKVEQFVGRCSTLRSPALRPWTGSLGYYANTRCGGTTWNASAVSTGHQVLVPVAVTSSVQLRDLQVNTYGGSARAVPGSQAVIRYLTSSWDWRNEKVLASWVGTHAGVRRTTATMIDRTHRYLRWGFATAYGNRYDVKSFTVVVRYYTWA